MEHANIWEAAASSARLQSQQMAAMQERINSIGSAFESERQTREAARDLARDSTRTEIEALVAAALEPERLARNILQRRVTELSAEVAQERAARAEDMRRIMSLEAQLADVRLEAQLLIARTAPAVNGMMMKKQQLEPPPGGPVPSNNIPAAAAKQQLAALNKGRARPHEDVGETVATVTAPTTATNGKIVMSTTESTATSVVMEEEQRSAVETTMETAIPAVEPAPLVPKVKAWQSSSESLSSVKNGSSSSSSVMSNGSSVKPASKKRPVDYVETNPVSSRQCSAEQVLELEEQLLQLCDDASNGTILCANLPRLFYYRFRKTLDFRALGFAKMSLLLSKMDRILFGGNQRAEISRKGKAAASTSSSSSSSNGASEQQQQEPPALEQQQPKDEQRQPEISSGSSSAGSSGGSSSTEQTAPPPPSQPADAPAMLHQQSSWAAIAAGGPSHPLQASAHAYIHGDDLDFSADPPLPSKQQPVMI